MYSITLRETNESVIIRSQPDFKKQVETNRKLRSIIGDKASNVLFVEVMNDKFEAMNVDTKALIIRFYHSKDKERQAMFLQAEAFMVAGDKIQAEEMTWLAVTKTSLIDSGSVDEDGNLKSYASYDNRKHRGKPLPAEAVDSGDFMFPL